MNAQLSGCDEDPDCDLATAVLRPVLAIVDAVIRLTDWPQGDVLSFSLVPLSVLGCCEVESQRVKRRVCGMNFHEYNIVKAITKRKERN